MKKKKVSILMTLLATTSLLAACGQVASNSNENGQSRAVVRKSTDSQSEIIKYTTTYNGKKYTKQAVVYLPKNYNAKEKHNILYFKYFVPMAGDSWTVTSDSGSAAPRRTAQVLANAAKKNSNLSFKIFAGVGSGDGTSESMEPQIRAMWNLPQFNRSNLEYYTQPGGNHDAPTMSRIINHYGKELFK